MQIRPLTITQVKPKRRVEKPDFSTLNAQQCEVVRTFRNFISSDSQYLLIEGEAGVGKTYTLSLCIEDLLFRYPKAYIAITAPVNKAVSVLTNQANLVDDRMLFGTIHSLAGLKLKHNSETFENEFVKDYENPCKLDEVSILVVDEASMLHDELLDILDTYYVQKGKLKIIFVGDGEQIPPVGQLKAAPFDEDVREELGIEYIALTEIVRQSKGNSIIDFVSVYRKNIRARNPLLHLQTNLDENGLGVLHLATTQTKELGRIIKGLFTSEYFKENANYAKVVAYTNDEVDAFNKAIRAVIFGRGLAKIVVGEKMLATDSIIDTETDKVAIHNSSEFEILSTTTKDKTFQETLKLVYYEASVKLSDNTTKVIRIIHEDSEEVYYKQLDKLYKAGLKQKDKAVREAIFSEFKALKNYFASVGYNYAITAHKAQGSTFQYCVVLAYDIFKQRRPSPKASEQIYERNRIGNTAFTRASETLIIVQ